MPTVQNAIGIVLALSVLITSAQSREVPQLQSVANSPTFQNVMDLSQDEDVYAYARIAPDGKRMAYVSIKRMADVADESNRTVKVLDLGSKKVLFSESGRDPYWSPDSASLIFQSEAPGNGVSVLNVFTNRLVRNIVPTELGDYFSWGRKGGRDVIMTIRGYYFEFAGKPVTEWRKMGRCPSLGAPTRPLISRDGLNASVFVAGVVAVRRVADCGGVTVTNVRGAKADWSHDGGLIAFHAPKPTTGTGYEINVVDLHNSRRWRLSQLPGSSFFPSWTDDGRLLFLYQAGSARTFVLASNVTSHHSESLPVPSARTPTSVDWQEIFPGDSPLPMAFRIALVWAPWNSHSPFAIRELESAIRTLQTTGTSIDATLLAEPNSRPSDAQRVLTALQTTLPSRSLAAERLWLTDADNQIPALLLFRGDRVIARHLGAMDRSELMEWVTEYTPHGRATEMTSTRGLISDKFDNR